MFFCFLAFISASRLSAHIFWSSHPPPLPSPPVAYIFLSPPLPSSPLPLPTFSLSAALFASAPLPIFWQIVFLLLCFYFRLDPLCLNILVFTPSPPLPSCPSHCRNFSLSFPSLPLLTFSVSCSLFLLNLSFLNPLFS